MENENRFWSVSLVLYPFYNKFNRFDRWCVSENDKLLQTKSRSHGHGWHLRHESSCPSNDAEITLCRPSWLKCRYRRKQTIGPLLPWMALLLKTPRTLSVWHWHISQSICLHSRYSTAIPDSSVSVIDQWQFSKTYECETSFASGDVSATVWVKSPRRSEQNHNESIIQ